jgi:hypothetical protein
MGNEQLEGVIVEAEALRDRYAGQVAVSASRLVNPLLDLWALAIEVGPDTAAPVEKLLTVYAGPRDLASPAELAELVERLRSTLVPAMA